MEDDEARVGFGTGGENSGREVRRRALPEDVAIRVHNIDPPWKLWPALIRGSEVSIMLVNGCTVNYRRASRTEGSGAACDGAAGW